MIRLRPLLLAMLAASLVACSAGEPAAPILANPVPAAPSVPWTASYEFAAPTP